MEHGSDGDTNFSRCTRYTRYSHQRIGKRSGGIGNKSSWKTIQNTALLRSTRIPRRVLETWGNLFVRKVTFQAPVEDHRLTLVLKVLKGEKNCNNNNDNIQKCHQRGKLLVKYLRPIRLSWNLEIQTNYLIQSKISDQELITQRKKLLSCRFCSSSGPQIENEIKRKDSQILQPCSRG